MIRHYQTENKVTTKQKKQHNTKLEQSVVSVTAAANDTDLIRASAPAVANVTTRVYIFKLAIYLNVRGKQRAFPPAVVLMYALTNYLGVRNYFLPSLSPALPRA